MADIDEILDRAEQTMKRCQSGTPYLDDAHSILADCYGTIGRLSGLIYQHNRDCDFQCDQRDCYRDKQTRLCPDCPKHHRIE